MYFKVKRLIWYNCKVHFLKKNYLSVLSKFSLHLSGFFNSY